MDSTNNEIYKIAKYLDKYTKYGNKEGGVYLQKLDNYLHKVQYGGDGIVQLAQQIGQIVTEVVEKHQKAKGELERLVKGVVGQNLKDRYENKLKVLKEQKEGLNIDIARKEAEKEKLASEASASEASAREASARAALEPITFEMLTSDNINSIDNTVLANIIYTLALEHATDKINDASILQLVRDVSVYGISEIIADIKSNFETLTASTILTKIYEYEGFTSLPKDYKTTILFIEITIAILKIKEKIIGIKDDGILELEKIVSFFISSSSEKCKESVSKLFKDFVNPGQTITSHNFTDFIEKDWRYLVSCTSETEYNSGLFTKEIIAKEVCRRMSITDEQKIQEIVKEFSNVSIFWSINNPIITFILYLNLLYKNQYFKDNAELAIYFAKELIEMKFDAIKIRELSSQQLSALGIENIESDKQSFRQQTGQIDSIIKDINDDTDRMRMFIDYVIEQQGVSSVPTLTGFQRYESSKASTVPASPKASSALASSPAPVLRATVSPSAEELAQQALATQLGKEAQKEKIKRETQKLTEGHPTEYDDLTSDTFYVMGYIVNHDSGKVFGKVDEGVYTFPGEQITVGKGDQQKRISVLSTDSQQLIIDALHITDQINSGYKLSLNYEKNIFIIKLNSPVKIREFVDGINKVKTVVQLTSSGDTKDVRLFVKPMSYTPPTSGKDLTYEQKQINEFAEIISKAIRLLVAQPPPPEQVQQSSSGSGARVRLQPPFRTQRLSQQSSSAIGAFSGP